IGHESAVRESKSPAPIWVGETLLNGPIGDTHDVAGVFVAPAAGDGSSICLAVPGGASWVGPHNVEAAAGQRGHLQPGCGSVRKVCTPLAVYAPHTLPPLPLRPHHPTPPV